MKILSATGNEDIAKVYIAETAGGKLIEFVESLQPPLPREKKWVLIVSTLYGCPVKCLMCDAGMQYKGRISKDDILRQIDYMVSKRFPDRIIKVEKFKIQFSRMGEPAFNHAVLDVLDEFDKYFTAPGFIPSISTIAPRQTESFFERLLNIKNAKYSRGNFQLQFSIHTTDEESRRKLMPVKKLSLREIAVLGDKFYQANDKKITLNFILTNEFPVEPVRIYNYFNPEKFLIKFTPLNPTYSAVQNNLTSFITESNGGETQLLIDEFKKFGYEVILSIGELEENKIGSNCGQYVIAHLKNSGEHSTGYKYINKNSILQNGIIPV